MPWECSQESFQLIEKGISSGITNCVSACQGKGTCCQNYSPRFTLLELGLLAAYDFDLAKEIIKQGTPIEIYEADPTGMNPWKLAFRVGQREDPCPFLLAQGCSLPYEVRTLPCRTYLCTKGKLHLFFHTSHYWKYRKMVKYIEQYDRLFHFHFLELLDAYHTIHQKTLNFDDEKWLNSLLSILMEQSEKYNEAFHDFFVHHWHPSHRPELHYHYTVDDFLKDFVQNHFTNPSV